jgi:DedD protein
LESILNTRLLGAAVIIALLVLFLPMFFSSSPPATSGGDQSVSLAIPAAPDRDLQTKTMSLTPGGAAPAGSAAVAPAASAQPPAATAVPAVAPAAGNQLAAVNISSTRPHDVGTDAAAPSASSQGPAPAVAPVAQQPLIPAQTRQAAPPQAPTQTPAPAPELPAATAARGQYTLGLSAYAPAGAENLMHRVRALGYPVAGRSIQRAGKSLVLVSAGPFDTRAAAEAARLKITQSIPGVPQARLESGASTPADDMPAAAPAGRPQAGGWAVQLAAMGSQADATALRDKLRANGFDGFVDTVNVGGRQLWRVRAGPQTQRDDALRIRDEIKAKLGVAGNVVTVP